jgi:dihydroxyacid dehydratase/phosphogluconate dehydratase
MLHLRGLNLLNLDCLTVSGQTIGENLDEWKNPSGAPGCVPAFKTPTAWTPMT